MHGKGRDLLTSKWLTGVRGGLLTIDDLVFKELILLNKAAGDQIHTFLTVGKSLFKWKEELLAVSIQLCDCGEKNPDFLGKCSSREL